MSRWNVLAAGAAVVVGAAFVTGASAPPRPVAEAAKPEAVKATVVSQKTGYFNIAKVMKEYKRAQNQVKELNDDRNRMSANVIKMREAYIKLQSKIPNETDAKEKEKQAKEMLDLARKIEDEDRRINKGLNERASEIISELHDEIRATVKTMAKDHGLVAVLAYPDAVTPEEANSSNIKEIRLKPPAAYPFYLDPSVDYTDELIERLNAKPAADKE
jgi:Skp family chaperone for outer membrane proteins